jgi:hypothetical protein
MVEGAEKQRPRLQMSSELSGPPLFSSLSLSLSERQLEQSARTKQASEKVRGGAIGVCSSHVWRAARPGSNPRAVSLLRLQERCACYFKVNLEREINRPANPVHAPLMKFGHKRHKEGRYEGQSLSDE